MSDINIQLKGWQAFLAVAVLAGLGIFRFMTFSDIRNDQDLLQQIDIQLMAEYSPYVAEKLQTAFETGDSGKLSESVQSITGTKVNIVSVKASYPVFDFSTPKDVVVKVVFSLDDAAEKGEEKTIYYLFRHGLFGWQYRYITSSLHYYLNFK